MRRHFLNPPNWVTGASLFCSVVALTYLLGRVTTPADVASACALVVVGGICDALDGRVARWMGRPSAFGTQLDSIADILGFGLAPAAIAWVWKLHALGPWGVAVTVGFVIAAAFRLARFNVRALSGRRSTLEGFSEGLTSTMGGGLLVTSAWLANGPLAGRIDPSPTAVAAGTTLIAYLMVSGLPFRDFKDARRSPMARALLVGGLAPAAVAGLALHPAYFFGWAGAFYLTFVLADGLRVAAARGLLAGALLLRDDVAGDREARASGDADGVGDDRVEHPGR